MNLTHKNIVAIQSSLGLQPSPRRFRTHSDPVAVVAMLRQRKVVQTLVPMLTDRDLVLGLFVALSGPSTACELSAVKRTNYVVGLLRLMRRVDKRREALRKEATLYVWSPRLFFSRHTGKLGEAVQRDRHSDHFDADHGDPSRWYCTACDQHYGLSYARTRHNDTAKHKRAARGFLA